MFNKLLLFSSLMVVGSAESHTIDVYYKGNFPIEQNVHGADISYIDLERLEKLESVFDQNLSSDMDVAIEQVNRYLSSQEGQVWIADMRSAARNIAKAYKLELKGVPAIVINDSAVIYGTFDVNHAFDIYMKRLGE